MAWVLRLEEIRDSKIVSRRKVLIIEHLTRVRRFAARYAASVIV